jgi:hypothetical protein
MSRDEAYRIVQHAAAAVTGGEYATLADALRKEEGISSEFADTLDALLSPEAALEGIPAIFERLP